MEKTVNEIGILNSDLFSDQFFFSVLSASPNSPTAGTLQIWYLIRLVQVLFTLSTVQMYTSGQLGSLYLEERSRLSALHGLAVSRGSAGGAANSSASGTASSSTASSSTSGSVINPPGWRPGELAQLCSMLQETRGLSRSTFSLFFWYPLLIFTDLSGTFFFFLFSSFPLVFTVNLGLVSIKYRNS